MDPYSSVGKKTDLYQDVAAALTLLLRGTVISIDPSVGSTSSMPAYAVYYKGKLVSANIIPIDKHSTIPERLQALHIAIHEIYKEWKPDILVYEDIPSQRYGGGNAEAHASLLKALGAILAVRGPRATVRSKPMVWKRLARSTYVKGDKEDAIEIGYTAIELARFISASSESISSSRRKRTKSS